LSPTTSEASAVVFWKIKGGRVGKADKREALDLTAPHRALRGRSRVQLADSKRKRKSVQRRAITWKGVRSILTFRAWGFHGRSVSPTLR